METREPRLEVTKVVKTERSAVPREDLRTCLLPRLLGHVFHVTRLDGVVAIRRDGEIRPNGDSASPFGKQDAYFRSKGYVSLFNYRDLEDEVLSLSLENCCPWQAAAYGIGIFFVSQSAHPRLITWSDELQQRSLGKMIVPHVEAGWPGPLGMEHVDHLWEITVT